MTEISREDISVGDIVGVYGYGGFAEVLHIEQDGYTPQEYPKYRVTLKWGPYNDTAGSAKRGIGIEDYALGRLFSADAQTADKRAADMEDMSLADMRARIAELEAEMMKA